MEGLPADGEAPFERQSSRALVDLLRAAGRVLLMPPRIARVLPPLAWMALIFFLSSFQPDLDGLGLSLFGGMGTNLLHPGVYGILALLLIPALAAREGRGRSAWTALTPEGGLWVVVLATLYGFTDELHQSVVEGRDPSLFDLLSDFVGALVVVRVVLYLGQPGADDRGLTRRLALGLVASIAAAGLATWYGSGPWIF